MSIMRFAVLLIVLPCMAPVAMAQAGSCTPPCVSFPYDAALSPLDGLKALFGLKTEESGQATTTPTPVPGTANKRRELGNAAIPVPRPRPSVPNPTALSPPVFAAAELPASQDMPPSPVLLVDEAFNEISVTDDDEYPALKAALSAHRVGTDVARP